MNSSEIYSMRVLGYILWTMVMLWLSAPIFIILLVSVSDCLFSGEFLEFNHSWMHWFAVAWEEKMLWLSIWSSISLSLVVAVASMFIGGLAAVFCVYSPGILANFVHGLIMLQLLLPEVIAVIFLAAWYNYIGIPLGLCATIAAHTTYYISVPFLFIRSGLLKIPNTVILAAKDLGATDLMIFIRVIIPNLYIEIGSSMLVVVLLSMDEFIINLFLSKGGFITIPVYIYSNAKRLYPSLIMAMVTIVFLIYSGIAVMLYSVVNWMSRV